MSPSAAVYCASKYAAWALTEGLRLTDPAAALAMRSYRSAAIAGDAIARAVSFALAQPADVDVNEIVIRAARQR